MCVHELEPLESDTMKTYTREYITFRLAYIARRRRANAMARSKGFRNYAEMSEYVA
jgi:hypothetical protein